MNDYVLATLAAEREAARLTEAQAASLGRQARCASPNRRARILGQLRTTSRGRVINLAAPAREVFDLLIDADRLPEWNVQYHEVLRSPGRPIGLGDEWMVDLHAMGRRTSISSRATEVNPAALHFEHRSCSEGDASSVAWSWQVTSQQSGTSLTVSWTLGPMSVWRRLLSGRRHSVIGQQVAASLEQIDQVLSNQSRSRGRPGRPGCVARRTGSELRMLRFLLPRVWSGNGIGTSRMRAHLAQTIPVRRRAVPARTDAGCTRRDPVDRGELICLRDGAPVLIRPIRVGDTGLLADGFARMSSRSRWLRFLHSKKELSARELQYLTDIDHVRHEALVAIDATDGRGIGVARYVRDVSDTHTAEVALATVDAWQHRGVATALLVRLTDRALAAGISHYTALVSADNVATLALLRRFGCNVDAVHDDFGLFETRIALPRRPLPS